jgi:high-affinity iron transporter
MGMDSFIQAFIMAFREGLEAFLVLAILFKLLEKTNATHLKKNVWYGVIAGLVVSLVFGALLAFLDARIGAVDSFAKVWESAASIVAVILVTFFIIWMIKHSGSISDYVKKQALHNLSARGMFLIAFVMLVREGVEIAIFSFAGAYVFLPVVLGLLFAIGLVVLIHYSLIRFDLKNLFAVTLVFLILQAGFLMGYGVHEGLSAAKDLNLIAKDNLFMSRLLTFLRLFWIIRKVLLVFL